MSSTSSSFSVPIPAEYQQDLDDEEILASLGQYAPVTSERNVWAFWDKGVAVMPGWCKRNVTNWVRILGPSWTVRVLDMVSDSPNHTLKYLPADFLPETFVHGTMDGPYVGPHSADFIRGAALYLHGGVFMDVGIMLIRHLDRVCWDALADEASPLRVSVPLTYGQIIANHFVAARKGDPYIKRWHDLFLHVWHGRTNYRGIIKHPVLQFALTTSSFDESKEASFNWNFKVDPETVFEYIAQVVCRTRLTHLDDAGDGFSCADYWEKKVLTFRAVDENWGAESMVGFEGPKLRDLLALRLDSEPSTPEYAKASNLVWRLLTRSSMQKVSHGKGLTSDVMLGALWDMPENETADCAPGTFAWLLRQGPLCLRQTRAAVQIVPAPPVKERWRKGVLEP
ncbi:uncharacterized protein B0T15DRAFT_545740 [Chaetomium strumarium]|uniref:Capsule polysaccharide biosynthesis protein n=1 Tax=Chaetomium strumarium TaxID=1170767 RepID=A0AAJ0M5P4_9PEZI|nr:hypothetical protein B0T15DRAFT_545740 [Chaetomium strumarium]